MTAFPHALASYWVANGNECIAGTCFVLRTPGHFTLPAELDLISIDFHCQWWGGGEVPGRGYVPGICASPLYNQTDPYFDKACHVNETLDWDQGCESNCSAPATCATWVKEYFTDYVIPKFGSSKTRAVFSPAAFGTDVWSTPGSNCSEQFPGLGWGGPCGKGQCGGGSGSEQTLSGCTSPPNNCLNPHNWSVSYEIEHGCPRAGCSGTYGFDWVRVHGAFRHTLRPNSAWCLSSCFVVQQRVLCKCRCSL